MDTWHAEHYYFVMFVMEYQLIWATGIVQDEIARVDGGHAAILKHRAASYAL